MARFCIYVGCTYNQFGGKYCRNHQYMRDDLKPKERKKRKAIKPYSDKRAKIQKEQYVPKMLKYLEDRPECAIKSPVCTFHSACVNHIKGRQTVERLLDDEWWEPSCTPCNNYIEEHPGFNDGKHKQSKFT